MPQDHNLENPSLPADRSEGENAGAEKASCEVTEALRVIDQVLGHVSNNEEIETTLAELEPELLQAVEEAAGHVISAAQADLQHSGGLLQGIANPVLRFEIFETHLLSLFEDEVLLARVMEEGNFSSQERERAAHWLAKRKIELEQQQEAARAAKDGPSQRRVRPWSEEHYDALTEAPAEVIFGEREIEQLAALRAEAGLRQSEMTPHSNDLESQITAAQESLRAAILKNPNCLSFFLEALKLEKSGPRLVALLKTSGLQEEELKFSGAPAAVSLLRAGTLTVDFLEEMAAERIAAFKKRRDLFETEKSPILVAEFKDRVLQLIRDGSLPLSTEQLEERLANVRLRLQDAVVPHGSIVSGGITLVEGTYHVPSHSIVVSEDLTNITHELVHAISGRTLVERYVSASKKPFRVRLGLEFNGRYSLFWSWLNEAKTEEIAGRILGENYSPLSEMFTYKQERETLNALYAQGLSREVVDQAYFEDHDPSAPPATRLAGYRALIKALNAMFPEGGAKRLHDIGEELRRGIGPAVPSLEDLLNDPRFKP